GIEGIWSTSRFNVPISFNVDWVTTGYDYSVNVTNSTGRWNMLNWYTIGAGGWGDAYQEEVAAHEYGHMIGEWDEYSGGAVDPVTKLINTGGIMHTLNGGTLDYYYKDFLAWYDNKLNSVPVIEPVEVVSATSSVAVVPVKPARVKKVKPAGVPVHEPSAILLLALGLISLWGSRRKFKK
ncbi:MAG TPA: PEP-CTERM sorting domain-containing protein, partial [Smithellaceae bacterium]|nr:PEP-CTERM sorting domain-containing protein [Smithellaceae bacterium]